MYQAQGGGENAGRQVGATLGSACCCTERDECPIHWLRLAAGWVAMFSQTKVLR